MNNKLFPMTKKHHISWIAIAQGQKTQLVNLEISDKPTTIFSVETGNFIATIYFINYKEYLFLCHFVF